MNRPAPDENREQRRAEIVRTALRLLDEEGLDRLSIRRVAQALGMHPPGLYWYIESKEELIDLLAAAILDDTLTGRAGLRPRETWDQWLIDLAVSMRRALLAHRDGARVVAGAHLFRTQALTPTLELALEILEQAGFPRETAMHGTITVVRYTMGVALDEQASPRESPREQLADSRTAAPDAPLVDPFRWPRTADAMQRYFGTLLANPEEMGEAHFRRGLDLVIAGLRQAAGMS